jgi:hypothetical protein
LLPLRLDEYCEHRRRLFGVGLSMAAEPLPAPPFPVEALPTLGRRSVLGVFTLQLLGCAAHPTAAPPEPNDIPPDVHLLEVAGAALELQFAPGLSSTTRALAQAWVRRSAAAVAGYFGRFPVPKVEVLIVPEAGAGVLGGASFGEPEALLRLRIGRATTQAQFSADWVLVHEMIHLAIPRLPRAHNWLHEGLATYLEALARGRAGLLPAEAVWHAWTRQMPLGQPQGNDSGLDHSPGWARTYWGGALFCLLADVRLRQRGTPERGLQQALQGVLAAGGDFRVAWPVTRVLATADAALGQTTLTALYDEMKDRAVQVDLGALWRDLGVAEAGLRDDAPLAAIRRAILS